MYKKYQYFFIVHHAFISRLCIIYKCLPKAPWCSTVFQLIYSTFIGRSNRWIFCPSQLYLQKKQICVMNFLTSICKSPWNSCGCLWGVNLCINWVKTFLNCYLHLRQLKTVSNTSICEWSITFLQIQLGCLNNNIAWSELKLSFGNGINNTCNKFLDLGSKYF